jgi:FlaG/FlaF family flagellin (archaellin)
MRDTLSEKQPHHNIPTPIMGALLMVAITVVVGSIAVVGILGFADQATTSVPVVAIEFEFVSEADGTDAFGTAGTGYDGHLQITHSDGRAVPADRLYVSGAASVTGVRPFTDSDAYDGDEAVSAGEGLSVWVDRNDDVTVSWVGAEGERSAVLGRWRGAPA